MLSKVTAIEINVYSGRSFKSRITWSFLSTDFRLTLTKSAKKNRYISIPVSLILIEVLNV